jgi:hypothetical protein
MSEQRPWHHLFGLTWMDFFHGTTVRVEEEKDLSSKMQLLDLVVCRPKDEPLPHRPPDGFTQLGRHNLFTFKSYQETLDDWALQELIGHYVNYRKQVSPSMQKLFPPEDFDLFAVCVRFPRDLAGQVAFTKIGAGVYTIDIIGKQVRIIVVHELPSEPQNAMLLMFSANEEQRLYGTNNFQQHSPDTSSVLFRFYNQYREEKLPMPETLEEFGRRMRREMMVTMTREERKQLWQDLDAENRRELLQAMSPEERRELLQSLPLAARTELLQSLPREERQVWFQSLPQEERREFIRGASPDELFDTLSPEVIETLARKLKDSQPPTSQKDQQ